MTAQARLLGGRYQVGELLGYGGMAEVHRGRDLRLGRDVAIKMLRTDLARDATFQMRFRREAQNAASLNHPAIVAVYDTGEETAPTGETIPFIVMEFVNGRTLKEVLAAEGRLMPRRVMEISADICAALEFSHRHGIIHRDIKPGNVMLTLTGQVKVMDFGIARALASGATTMTQTSAVIGTAQYLSPEQARGEAVDARSDVYAAGCVVFELLCGHPPFVGDSPVSVAYQHVREDPPTPSSINPDITPPIDAIILKALSKNPLNRYQSAGEMRADLLRAATGRPVMATPVMQHDETVPMAPSGGRSAAGGAGGGRPTPPSARVGDGRRRTPAWVMATLSGLGVLAVIALVAGIVLSNQPKNVTVPTVLDMSRADAIAELTKAKLQYQVGEEEFTSTCKKGLVTRQDPQPSEEVAEQTPVTIRVCGGAPQVKIPELVGGEFDFVEGQLKGLKLKVTRKDVENERPEGIVVKLSPAPGEMVAENTEIIVEVSKGNLKAVPDVVDKTEQEARAELIAAGFRVSVKYRDSNKTPGTVLDQSPNANQKRRTGTVITITVAREMQPSQGPSGTPSASPPAGG